MAHAWPPLRPIPALTPPETVSAATQQQQQLLDSFRGSLRDYDLGTTKVVPPGASWQSMMEAVTILPELTAAAHDLIERYLGYRPHVHTMQLHDAFLRAVMMHQRAGHLADGEYRSQVEQCVKAIRNGEMNAITWQANAAAARQRYATDLAPFAQPARARLATFLGYAPDIQHSLAAELWLRQVLAQDVYHLPDEETALDRKALVYVKYREVLTALGQAAAHSSPLWATV